MAMKMGVFSIGLLISLMPACVDPVDDHDQRQIAISEHNDLGVIAVQLDRYDDHGDHVFELRGLNSNAGEVALVRLRIGEIADLASAALSSSGSELVLSSGDGDSVRIVSRETAHLMIPPVGSHPVINAFVSLRTVSALLESEAHISTPGRPVPDATATAGETSYDGPRGEYQPYTYNCPASFLNTQTREGDSYVAQCCWTSNYPYGDYYTPYTLFVIPSTGLMAYRYGPRTPCTAYDGSSCSGSGCYFGPNGFSTPELYNFSGDQINTTYDEGIYCAPYVGFGVTFPTQTGTIPTGQRCPGGNDSSGYWDY